MKAEFELKGNTCYYDITKSDGKKVRRVVKFSQLSHAPEPINQKKGELMGEFEARAKRVASGREQ
jgi:hypothetical protein